MSDGVMSQEEIDALVGGDPDPLSGDGDNVPTASAPDSAPAAAAPVEARTAIPPEPTAAAPAPAPTPAAPASAAPAAAPAPAPTDPGTVAPTGPAPTMIIPANGANSDVVQRLANLEAAVAVLQQSAGGGQNDAVVQALSQQVQVLTAQLSQLGQHLQNSLGFGLRGSFQCASCSAQGMVGSRVSCMHCGTESWIGWTG